jgi:hypothetical protein
MLCMGFGDQRFLAAVAAARAFTADVLMLQKEAIGMSNNICGNVSELNKWMGIAKSQRLTWRDGLVFAVEKMRAKGSSSGTSFEV